MNLTKLEMLVNLAECMHAEGVAFGKMSYTTGESEPFSTLFIVVSNSTALFMRDTTPPLLSLI